jgi:N-acetylmuramoyl-L-alanine amidase
VQREVTARTDLLDLRTHPCSFDIVRMTKMPAVLMGLGYLSNPGDAKRLGDPGLRDTIADAVVVAVQRLYLADDDARTGTLNLKDVLAHAGRGQQ